MQWRIKDWLKWCVAGGLVLCLFQRCFRELLWDGAGAADLVRGYSAAIYPLLWLFYAEGVSGRVTPGDSAWAVIGFMAGVLTLLSLPYFILAGACAYCAWRDSIKPAEEDGGY